MKISFCFRQITISLFLLFNFASSAPCQGDSTKKHQVPPMKVQVDSFEDRTIHLQLMTLIVTAAGTLGNLIGLLLVYRTLRAAEKQIRVQVKLAKDNNLNQRELEKVSHTNQLKILKLGTNASMAYELHKQFLIHPELLRFHKTSKQAIEAIGLNVNEFLYILNSILASEFYYDGWGSKEAILDDLSVYRMQFLNQKEVKDAWKEIIKKSWTMAPEYVEAVETFYDNPNDYINKKQGTEKMM